MTPRPATCHASDSTGPLLDGIDRQIIVATQAGLPRVPRPYHAIAEQLGVAAKRSWRACGACWKRA